MAIKEPTKDEIEFAKRLGKDMREHYEEDKREAGFSFVDYARQQKIELWRLAGAFWELDRKFHLEIDKPVPIKEADKIFLKWGLYRIMDEELTRVKREKLMKKLLELLTL